MDVAIERPERARARLLLRLARNVTAKQAVWASTSIAGIGWAVVAIVRDSRFIDKRQDVGNFTQAVWATAHGHFLQVTEAGGTEVSRLGIHVDPIIAALAPLWWLWPSPRLLLTVEAVTLAVGAIPLFWLARKHLPRERDAALLAVAYLLSPTVEWNAVTDFHSVAIAVPALLFAIWYLDEDRLVPFAVAAGIAMLCQEQIGLMVGCLGLWYAWRRRQLATGLTIAALGFAVSAVDFLVIIRHFSGGSPYAARFGGSPTGLVRDLFTHPLRLVERLDGRDVLGLFLIGLPVLGLCFGSTIMLAALPQIALLLLSLRPHDWLLGGVNMLPLIPFIYAAAAFVLARSAQRSGKERPRFVAAQVLAGSVGIALLLGPFGLASVRLFHARASVSAQQHAVSLVPAGVPVSATNHLALPLTARRHLYVFPVVKDADWVLVDSRDASLPDMSFIHHRAGIEVGISDLYWQPKVMHRYLLRFEQSPNWQLVYRRDDIYAFRRNGR